MSTEILSGMEEWRGEHPKATLREIEAEVDERLADLRVKMISDTANKSVQAEWEAAEGVACPECFTQSLVLNMSLHQLKFGILFSKNAFTPS